MLSKTTLLFSILIAACSGGALLSPVLGALGYIGVYCVGPERQWWHGPLRPLGIRYSYTLALLTAVGMVLNWRRLRFGARLLISQEKLILLFLGVVWLSVAISEKTTGAYTQQVDHPSMKLTKMVVFLLMLTHVVTDSKNLNRLLWVLTLGALVLGLQAYDVPRSAFWMGRLETVGGPDFRDANTLAMFLATVLPVIGAQFFRSKWKGKLICLISGAFAANAIVLTRSRGAVLGLGVGMIVTLLLAPKKHRMKIAAGLLVAMIGGIQLADPGFWKRAKSIGHTEDERDTATRSRVEIWQGGLEMLWDNPQGVGAGNFQQTIGRYARKHPKRDAHSTYVRCGGELGFLGLGVLGMLLANGLFTLLKVARRARELPHPVQDQLLYASHGLLVSLVVFIVCGLTGTLLYVEGFWWCLAMPVCLLRVLENLEKDVSLEGPTVASRGRRVSAIATGRSVPTGAPAPQAAGGVTNGL